jgi:hypothetical protein
MADKILIDQARKILSLHLGDKAAEMYAKFYQDKTDNTVIASVEELMTELIGPKRASFELEVIKKSIMKEAVK